jgi:hypothetical protein
MERLAESDGFAFVYGCLPVRSSSSPTGEALVLTSPFPLSWGQCVGFNILQRSDVFRMCEMIRG